MECAKSCMFIQVVFCTVVRANGGCQVRHRTLAARTTRNGDRVRVRRAWAAGNRVMGRARYATGNEVRGAGPDGACKLEICRRRIGLGRAPPQVGIERIKCGTRGSPATQGSIFDSRRWRCQASCAAIRAHTLLEDIVMTSIPSQPVSFSHQSVAGDSQQAAHRRDSLGSVVTSAASAAKTYAPAVVGIAVGIGCVALTGSIIRAVSAGLSSESAMAASALASAVVGAAAGVIGGAVALGAAATGIAISSELRDNRPDTAAAYIAIAGGAAGAALGAASGALYGAARPFIDHA